MANYYSLLIFLMAFTITNLRLISTTDSLPPSTHPTIPPPPPPLPSRPTTSPPPPLRSPPIISPPIISPPPASPPTIIPPPPPPPSPSQLQQQQLNTIIEALIGAGDFAVWANILSSTDPSTLPLTATLFIPDNDAISHLPTATTTGFSFDPLIIPYHIVPQRLTFSDLQLFTTHSRLPTLFPTKTILITNNSLSNFTVDNSPITHPDFYVNSAVSLHGIGTILDYTIYGGDGLFPPPDHPFAPPQVVVPPVFENGGRARSDAACLCTEFPMVLSVICAAFLVKIHRNGLSR